jgi:hypothetical protein
MHPIATTLHTTRRGHAARALASLALAGLLLAPQLGHALPRASAATPHWRSVVLVNADGTTYTELTLLSAPFRTAAPVTMVWKVASAHATGLPSRFAVALLDAQGRTRARLADTTRAGRASATIVPACLPGCTFSIRVANMHYALVGYALAPAR